MCASLVGGIGGAYMDHPRRTLASVRILRRQLRCPGLEVRLWPMPFCPTCAM